MNHARFIPQSGRLRRSRQGMVLLELVIALFIFTTVAFSLVLALDTSFDTAKKRDEIDVAMRGLENQLVLLRGAQITPADRDLPDDGTGIAYHLLIEVEQLQDQKNQPVQGIYRATITAKWQTGNQTDGRSVSELIYQP